MLRTTARQLIALAAVTTLAACSENAAITPPAETAPENLALTASSLDQEAARASAAGDTSRASAFREAAAAMRFGVRPSPVSIAVQGETHRYVAVVTANVVRLASGDSALRRAFIAWRGDNRPTDLLHLMTMADQGAFSGDAATATDPRGRAHGLWVNLVRTSRWLATDGFAKLELGNTGGACNPPGEAEPNVRCVQANFGFEVDGLFRVHGASPDANAPAARIKALPQRVDGVILRKP